MSRPARTIVDGGTYHVFSRGSNQLGVYFDDFDYSDFLELLARLVDRDDWLLYAYCLMPNHFHLLLTVREAGLSNGMRELNGGFSRRTSLKYGRTAHLFKNRFGLVTVETEVQFLRSARYIVLNPVAAGLCAHPRQWRWSSYRATAGLERAPRWLAVGDLLKSFRFADESPRNTYRHFVEEGVSAVSGTVAELQPSVPNA
jgi:putative transposase